MPEAGGGRDTDLKEEWNTDQEIASRGPSEASASMTIMRFEQVNILTEK